MSQFMCVRRLLLSVMLVLLAAPVLSFSADEEALAPYLYYYSTILNAFVIERADGTDSRIMAQDVVPLHHHEIVGPVWSPSGRWMAWRSAEFGGPGPSYYSGWIMRSDGSERLTLLDHPPEQVVNVSVMEWAEDQDLLFVVLTSASALGEKALIRYLLIDVEAGVIRAAHETPNKPFWNDPIGWTWLPDGQGVAILVTTFVRDQPYVLEYVRLKADGTTPHDVHSAHIGIGLSPYGSLAYVSADQQTLVIAGPDDGSSQRFPLTGRSEASDRPMNPDQIGWNPAQDIAFFYQRTDEKYDLWLLDLASRERFQVQTDVQLLSTEVTTRGIRHPAFLPGLWSPDGLLYIFLSGDGTYRLFELASRTVTVLDSMPEYQTLRWAENSLQLLLSDERGIHVYDVGSQQSTFVERIIDPETYPGYSEPFKHVYPSPDGKSLGLTDHAIADLTFGSIRSFSVHSAATYATSLVSYYDWHSDGQWVIAAANVTHAGCCGPTAYTVLKSDPSQRPARRELTVQWGGAGWLPQRVAPYLSAGQATSAIQQPAITRQFDDLVTGLAWRPNSHQLAVHTHSGIVSILDFNPSIGNQSETLEFQMAPRCDSFPLPCPMYWDAENIVVGNYRWNTVQATYGPIDNQDRITCFRSSCTEVLTDITSSDGRWLARWQDVPGTRIVDIVDTSSGEVTATIETVQEMAWVDSRLILTANREILTFDAETATTVILASAGESLTGGAFYEMSVSPESRLIAGTSIYNAIHIWNTDTGDLETVLNWYGLALVFSPDGRRLAAGNSDLVTIWDVSEFMDDR